MKQALLVATALVLLTGAASACIWDHDTLRMEQRRFPDALELVTGRFLRHSKGYYRWRIEDRERRLKKSPDDLRLLDDLAVAYEKTGNVKKSIEITLAKAKLKPNLYETEANLGTFYIHAGDLEQGLQHIRRAIEINPEAHFGREVYQQRLVEYVLSKKIEGKLKLPMDTASPGSGARGFASYVLEKARVEKGLKPAQEEEEIRAATKGVLGMMRFGNYDSPVLLEALGDLLMAERGHDGARRLATRAYLKASMEQEGYARKLYRLKAESALLSQTIKNGKQERLTLAVVQEQLEKELSEAKDWYARVVEDERAWIEEGGDVDARFDAKYYEVAKGKAKKEKAADGR